ncbi:membrane protein [Thermaurantimonas aggregans]|uniref:Membrane protein n=1 Tax=Thermaurantimonas aggregans TaxID=2173829 RepID=A0A401XLV4_9FLAO|nr:CBS domain-containing protein [Thermaurantimonas aggregans]MCX8149550.1 CBS domain-containing protein [Thermaurantimonas aggregans]GCD77974.1 membrane protein [Thermaurantimonas aggregans]
MNLDIPITEIMTKQVLTIDVKKHPADAEKLMKKHKIRHVPVVKAGKIVGMLSLTDLLRISFADAVTEDDFSPEVYDMFTIDQLMNRHVKALSPADTVRTAAELFVNNPIHALPVVNDAGEPIGIVTTTDLIKLMLA